MSLFLLLRGGGGGGGTQAGYRSIAAFWLGGASASVGGGGFNVAWAAYANVILGASRND